MQLVDVIHFSLHSRDCAIRYDSKLFNVDYSSIGLINCNYLVDLMVMVWVNKTFYVLHICTHARHVEHYRFSTHVQCMVRFMYFDHDLLSFVVVR